MVGEINSKYKLYLDTSGAIREKAYRNAKTYTIRNQSERSLTCHYQISCHSNLFLSLITLCKNLCNCRARSGKKERIKPELSIKTILPPCNGYCERAYYGFHALIGRRTLAKSTQLIVGQIKMIKCRNISLRFRNDIETHTQNRHSIL